MPAPHFFAGGAAINMQKMIFEYKKKLFIT